MVKKTKKTWVGILEKKTYEFFFEKKPIQTNHFHLENKLMIFFSKFILLITLTRYDFIFFFSLIHLTWSWALGNKNVDDHEMNAEAHSFEVTLLDA